jgi:hypothetical protein
VIAHVGGLPLEETLLPLMSMSVLVGLRAVVVSAPARRRRRGTTATPGGAEQS